ncbi:BrnT family toxin [Microbulbifer salipaludis]|uniref:BrnT family toxin n=1 Tax=Microbulbifer salipaludis TaxID=187980 RepID=A0ABS3E4D2_9GAMM|nr:BrnT family toxin [Microbulbifer salipaludis]MBN8430162.1 BrnT family toxin [Microbulbifer salipaludis]
MEFEWDENKNQSNWLKHRVDFADAIHIFLDDDRVEREDTRKDYGESRFQTIGTTEHGILFVIYTERNGDTIRLISARKANRKERGFYASGVFKPFSVEVKNGR